jgi:hypothetical protein
VLNEEQIRNRVKYCTVYTVQVSTVVDYMFLYTSMALYGGLVTRQRDRYLTPDLR